MAKAKHPRIDDRGIVVSCSECSQRNRVPFEKLDQPPRCGRCAKPLGGIDRPVEISGEPAFTNLTNRAAVPVLLDFWAPWCGPCRMVAPELEKVAARNSGRLLVAKLDTQQHPNLGQRLGIMSIPTMAVYWRGREIGRQAGARPADAIERWALEAVRTG